MLKNTINRIPKKPVVIVGGGWAGLATACFLAQQNIPVSLYESAKQLGGRARKSNSRTQLLDNGQHLMMGAYQDMLGLLKMIGVDESTVFQRSNQHLKIINGRTLDALIELKLPSLPSPFNLVAGLLLAKGLGFSEKLLILRRFDKLLKENLSIENDVSVSQWLMSAELPTTYLTFLKSLCLAAMNTPAAEASALNFQNVLKQTFNGPSGSTDLLIPSVNLGSVLPSPARQFLLSKRATIHSPKKITKLVLDDNYLVQIEADDHNEEASAVILATPAHITSALLKPVESCNELCHNLDQLRYQAITTIYLRYEAQCQIPEIMLGLTNTYAEWIFDRRVCEQPGMIAVVISSSDQHSDIDNKDLSLIIRNELAVIFPDWPKPLASWVIREKRATFACTPDSNQHRPDTITPIDNVFLAADYLATNSEYLPATLETAIRNAKACAEEVVNYLNQTQ